MSNKLPLDIKFSSISSTVAPIPSQSNRFGGTLSILFRWKKSVYKLLWKHMLIYVILYVSLSLLYKLGLNDEHQKQFRTLAKYASDNSRSINLIIILGFFTTTALQRLFTMQNTLPGIAKSTTVFLLSLKPDLPEGSFKVDQFARWHLLLWVLSFRMVSRPLRLIFPDMNSIQSKGLLTEHEKYIMEKEEAYLGTPRPMIVIDWILLLLKESYAKGRFISESSIYMKNVDNLMALKKNLKNTIKFGVHNIPSSMIQAVCLIVYGYGIITLMARTFTDDDDSTVEVIQAYFPFLPGLQFFIYFAWLCFGKAAVDPFGDDDDDIDVRGLLQCHINSCLRMGELYKRKLEETFPIGSTSTTQYLTIPEITVLE